MIALLIGYQSISRILNSAPIHFAEAIPIACLGPTSSENPWPTYVPLRTPTVQVQDIGNT
jgi:hypothetical protein